MTHISSSTMSNIPYDLIDGLTNYDVFLQINYTTVYKVVTIVSDLAALHYEYLLCFKELLQK